MGDLRMRFQSGIADLSNPEAKQTPKPAVTTRTLEALIRLATAHAKLKLRKEEVLPEDVVEAFNLMLVAREENDASILPASDLQTDAVIDDPTTMDRGQKRAREEEMLGGDISTGRLSSLMLLISRTFATQRRQDIAGTELLEFVNA